MLLGTFPCFLGDQLKVDKQDKRQKQGVGDKKGGTSNLEGQDHTSASEASKRIFSASARDLVTGLFPRTRSTFYAPDHHPRQFRDMGVHRPVLLFLGLFENAKENLKNTKDSPHLANPLKIQENKQKTLKKTKEISSKKTPRPQKHQG